MCLKSASQPGRRNRWYVQRKLPSHSDFLDRPFKFYKSDHFSFSSISTFNISSILFLAPLNRCKSLFFSNHVGNMRVSTVYKMAAAR